MTIIKISLIMLITFCTGLAALGNIVHVRKNGTGDGSSWADASGDFQGSVDSLTNSGGQVWVSAGTYFPDRWPNGIDNENNTSIEQEAHFSLRNGVRVLGGFPPDNDAATLADREPNQFETIFSGDIGVYGERSDDAYHVFYHPASAALDKSAVLDGGIITKGHSGLVVYTSEHNHGGGMYNQNSSPTLKGCVFKGNYASYSGGGVYNEGSTPDIVDCKFSNNSAGHGGGILSSTSNPTITNCIFVGNVAEYNGGGCNNTSGTALYEHCIFSSNRADNGASVYNASSNPRFNNCLFNNYVTSALDAEFLSVNSRPTLIGCTLFAAEGNNGIGILNSGVSHNYGSSHSYITNCVVWGYASSRGNIANNSGSSAYITHSLIQGGYEGSGNSDLNPRFVNSEIPIGRDNEWGTFDDGLALGYGSPAIGSASLNLGLSGVDLCGNPRSHDGLLDMGAYSFFPDPDGDGMADIWEQQIVIASSGTISNVEGVLSHMDFDGDGRDNKNEFVAGTDPLNPSSRFNYSLDISTGEIHYYPCMEGRSYSCAWTIDLQHGSWTEISIPSVSDGSTGETISLPDTSPHNSEPRIFYNVLIEM